MKNKKKELKMKMKSEMSCNQQMIKIIEILNKLQDRLVSLGVTELVKELPQIAVVGSQSAGKSSVLESFVGRDFLPRGKDIVTRRPLILQLKHNVDDRTFAKFNHSEKEFTDFDEIRREIERETDRTVPNYGISADPINLMITSPDVLDLNLIDLPGMTKIPVGEQPTNIEDIVKDLIMGFISNKNCLILAVTPANQDLSTSDAIKLAREVDIEGNRTIGVLTKLDLMDKGTDARKILQNKHKIRLKRGFIGVVCRSPKDIENNKKLSDAIADEKSFFAEHPAYHDLINHLGIEYLQTYLQNELATHLFEELPVLHRKFQKSLRLLSVRLEKISIERIRQLTPNELISNTVKQFSESFCNEIGSGDDVPVDRRNCGTNINIEMNIKYADKLEAIVRNEKRIKKEIKIAIVNIYGTKFQLFVPNKAFSIVVKKQLEHMRPASLTCVDNVYRELEAVVKNCSKAVEISNIADMYTDTTLAYLKECWNKCREMVEHKLDTEKTYFSATHVDFLKLIRTKRTIGLKKVPLSTTILNENISKSEYITYNGTMFYFSIESRVLNWYDTNLHNRWRGAINLQGVQLNISGEKTLILKSNSKSKKQIEIKLEFESKDILMDWVTAIMSNAYNESDPKEDNSEKVEDNDEESDSDNNYPINIDSQVEEVKDLVMSYIKVIEQTLKDTLPKICQKELIDAMETFVKDTLRNQIQNKGLTIDDLVDRDPNAEERKNLLKRQSLYEDALQTMDEVMKTTMSVSA